MRFILRKGFTLIELLVTIGILAVVAAGVVALIDPVDKNRQAQDTKVISDIGQVATALQSYAAQNAGGLYPATAWAAMSTAIGTGAGGTGELIAVPTAPTGYAAYIYTLTGTTACLHGQVISRKHVNPAAPVGCNAVVPCYWKWSSATGVTTHVTTTTCP